MDTGSNGAVALVTGAGGGIGQAAALELARRGADVAVHYHQNEAGARDTARRIDALGRRAAIFKADLACAPQIEGLVAAVLERFGAIDILVNNAGDLVERRSLLDLSEPLWRRVIDLNLTSAFLVTRAVAASMVARERGVIVNVSSLAAHNGGGPGAVAYAAAKGGLMSFTRAIAKELAPKGLRVNCIAPGLIGDTSFHGRFTPADTFRTIEKTIPIGRAGTPDEVANVIAFLCGPDSAYLVGETIEINGGMLMR
jgi:3-oxoacyl-[acyl-carrier protein] reductase